MLTGSHLAVSPRLYASRGADAYVRHLKYSESGAQRRITAARCLDENPEVAALLKEGKLIISTVSMASKCIKAEITQLSDLIGKSTREVQGMLSKAEPVSVKPREFIKPVAVKPALEPMKEPEERVSIKFSLPKEVYGQFELARAKLSNSTCGELSAEAVVTKLLEHFLKPAKVRASNPDNRYVSKSMKEALYKRDGCQCSFESQDGIRCTQKQFLQIDHVLPFSVGGKTELNNLRLLCPSHNRLMAKRYFGKEFLQKYICKEPSPEYQC